MRVLILHDFGRRIGGAEHLSLVLRDALQARGHEARLLASTADVMRRETPLKFEADYACYGTNGPLHRLVRIANPLAAHAVRRAIGEFQPDVVHVRMFLSQLSPLILPALRDVASLLHVVNYLPICPMDTKTLPDGSACRHRPGMVCAGEGCLPWLGGVRAKVQYGLLRRHFDVFDDVIANSRWVQAKLLDDGLRCDGYIWNGVPARPARPPLLGPPTVGYAGRIEPKKGVEVLIRAMALVREQLPEARLIVAGDGPELGSIRSLAAKFGVAESVEFAGHMSHNEMEPLLGRAWVQAVPSVWEEPFGIACAEAMMRGTAVAASASGGLIEQVIEGETGVLIPPGDVNAWAARLVELLRDQPTCERFGRAGRERALSTFSETLFVDNVMKRYAQLLT